MPMRGRRSKSTSGARPERDHRHPARRIGIGLHGRLGFDQNRQALHGASILQAALRHHVLRRRSVCRAFAFRQAPSDGR